MMNILIIGHGIVGKRMEIELEKFSPDVLDKYKPDENKLSNNTEGYDLAFICVNTPFTDESPCDCSEVVNAINENSHLMKDEGIFVIKSTVLPGTTDKIRKQTGQNVIFSPEYYGETQHCNNFDFDFTILGGEKQDCIKVVQILQKIYDGRHSFRITDSKTAEIAKYMENAWLATKVSFCSQFFEIAENNGINYEELRELFILDPRVNPSHTFIYRDHPYWDSHCLNKDVPAIAITEDAKFLKYVIEYNSNKKNE
jgi:nucleotide sugar dehydrogenase